MGELQLGLAGCRELDLTQKAMSSYRHGQPLPEILQELQTRVLPTLVCSADAEACSDSSHEKALENPCTHYDMCDDFP